MSKRVSARPDEGARRRQKVEAKAEVAWQAKVDRELFFVAQLPGGAAVIPRQLYDGAAADGYVDDQGNTALIAASAFGHADNAFALLCATPPPDLDRANGDGNTALQLACDAGHIEVALVLLEAGADTEVRRQHIANRGNTALHVASWSGHAQIVQLLLAHGAAKDARSLDCDTALIRAARRDHTDVVEALLAAGADPNIAGDDANTPLRWATAQMSAETMALLLDGGADPNARFGDGSTALLTACFAGHTNLAILLLDKGAEVLFANDKGERALHAAAMAGSIDITVMLLDAGADTCVDAPSLNGDTALMCACRGGYTAIVRALLGAGANPLCARHEGDTALHAAATVGSTDIVTMLLYAGADKCVDGTSADGDTALICASRGGFTAIVRALLDKDAFVHCVNGKGADALYAAATAGSVDIVTMLLHAGAGMCVDAACEDGHTALMRASHGGHAAIVRALLRAGANHCVWNHKKHTAIAIAATADAAHPEVVQVLLRARWEFPVLVQGAVYEVAYGHGYPETYGAALGQMLSRDTGFWMLSQHRVEIAWSLLDAGASLDESSMGSGHYEVRMKNVFHLLEEDEPTLPPPPLLSVWVPESAATFGHYTNPQPTYLVQKAKYHAAMGLLAKAVSPRKRAAAFRIHRFWRDACFDPVFAHARKHVKRLALGE